MIEIREVRTKKDLKLFAKYPLRLYKGCPYYVPSLRGDEMSTFNPKKNFSLMECEAKGFLCYKDGELAGRIAGIIHKTDNELTGKKYIRFSRFECIDDIEVFRALLGAVEKGLGGCMIGSFRKPELKALLKLPEGIEPNLAVALGKPAEKVVLTEVGPDGDTRYYRDGNDVHYVPKRRLEDIVL